MNQKIVVANWKMFKSFDETIDFLKNNLVTLDALAKKHSLSLWIAPNSLALAHAAKMVISSSIRLASQDVSAHESGPYTGQIDARSLKSLGISYCLIGHSELRDPYHLSNDDIALKVGTAINNDITPIVCIGESLQEYESGQTEHALSSQLEPIFKLMKTKNYSQTWYIAYEPIWAINSGKGISLQDLKRVLDHITKIYPSHLSQAQFLYGGSVNSSTIESLAQETRLSGFLVGKASTEIESLSELITRI